MTQRRKIDFEFVVTESCIDDMRFLHKKHQLTEGEWDKIVYQARLETENYAYFQRFIKSERIMNAKYHIRRLKVSNWRILFLVHEQTYVFYGIALWPRNTAYKKHMMENLEERAVMIHKEITAGTANP
jgi:hypothetical protein